MTAPRAPAFFGTTGPTLSFIPAVTDQVREVWAVVGNEDSPRHVITLKTADVRQLRDFCIEWLCADMTTEEMIAEVDAGLARARALLGGR